MTQHQKLEKVFVYGTLKRGRGNHHFLANQRLIGNATTVQTYLMWDGIGFPRVGVPCGMFKSYAAPVCGELYSVDAEALAGMDRLEDHPKFYKRTEITVYLGKQPVKAWCYLIVDSPKHSPVRPDAVTKTLTW